MKSIFGKLFSKPIPAPIVQVPAPDTQNRALSIRQPHAEMILRGKKEFEYRRQTTNIRGWVYIYAGLAPADQGFFL